MNYLIRIFTLSLLVAATSFKAEAKKKRTIETTVVDTIDATIGFGPNVTIHTPTTEIYNDGSDIIQYEGYSVFNRNNKEILTVTASIHRPVRLRLQAGNYVVKLEGQKSPVYRIAVVEGQYNEFAIADSGK